MTELLTDLLNAGLIDKLDGDDDRFTKMERAAEAVAQELRDHPPMLIRAILAGLDPDIPADDPAIVQAERALTAKWKSMRSVHTDCPVNLLRAILLEACNQAADDGTNAAILWLTAADTLPLLRLGKEGTVIRQALEAWALSAEKRSIFTSASASSANSSEQAALGKLKLPKIVEIETPKTNRVGLLQKVQASVGPNNEQSQTLSDPNQYWTNSAPQWSYQFAPKMRNLLADELDTLASNLSKSRSDANQQIQDHLTKLTAFVNKALISQQNGVLESQKAEQIRLNALWWSEALYSSSLSCSYRELPQSIATVVMATDLLTEVTKPTPASVGYLLAEAVNRLPEAGFDRKLTLRVILESLAQDRNRLSKEWKETLIHPPETGRLSLRDLVILILAGNAPDINAALTRTGASGEFEMSLPKFAHALFRQEQAVQLVGSGQ